MVDLVLHPMKEVRVVVSGEQRRMVTDLLDRIEASGYTVIAITERDMEDCRSLTSCLVTWKVLR